MPQSPWTTTQSQKGATSVSYAERLRQATHQKAAAFDKDHAQKPGPTLIPRQDESPKQTEPVSMPRDPGTAQNEKLSAEASPSWSPTNVWETRMRQRQAQKTLSSDAGVQMERNTSAQSKTSTQPDPSGSHSPSPVRATDAQSPDHAGPSNGSDENGNGLLSASEEASPASLGIPPDDDAWLNRILMLNGGELVSRYGKSAPNPSSSTKESNTEHAKTDTHHPKPSASFPVFPVSPSQLPLSSSDGSFAPVRSSDQHNSTMQAYAHAARSGAMGYYPMMPVIPGDVSMDDRNWIRRGRDGRGRGRGTGRGRGVPFAPPSAYPSYSPKIMPFMVLPGVPVYPLPGMHLAGPIEGDGATTASPVSSRAESQGNGSDLEDSRSEAGEQSAAPAESIPGAARSANHRRTHNTAVQPTTHPLYPNVRGPPIPFPYMLPSQPPQAQFDPAFGLIIPPSGFPIPPNGMAPPLDSPMLMHQLLLQLEFYFSETNLEQDLFLRQQMDAQGFVSLDIVLNFKRIQNILQSAAQVSPGQAPLSKDRQLLLLRNTVASSRVLELDQGRSHVRHKLIWSRYVSQPDQHDTE